MAKKMIILKTTNKSIVTQFQNAIEAFNSYLDDIKSIQNKSGWIIPVNGNYIAICVYEIFLWTTKSELEPAKSAEPPKSSGSIAP